MKKEKIIAIIPSRYASTRLPGKALADIAGKTMIQRVYEQVKKASLLDDVIVATDHEKIYSHVKSFGGKVVMTDKDHPSGTDRLAEAVSLYGDDIAIVINVQGDEPLIDPSIIDDLASVLLEDKNLPMATVKTLLKEDEMNETSAVKVVTDKDGYALYFSRSLIPHPHNDELFKGYKHLGIYAYRKDFLLSFTKMEQSFLEKIESLEQLRVLENGYKIKVIQTDFSCIGVDTQEDLDKVNELFEKCFK